MQAGNQVTLHAAMVLIIDTLKKFKRGLTLTELGEKTKIVRLKDNKQLLDYIFENPHLIYDGMWLLGHVLTPCRRQRSTQIQISV